MSQANDTDLDFHTLLIILIIRNDVLLIIMRNRIILVMAD